MDPEADNFLRSCMLSCVHCMSAEFQAFFGAHELNLNCLLFLFHSCTKIRTSMLRGKCRNVFVLLPWKWWCTSKLVLRCFFHSRNPSNFLFSFHQFKRNCWSLGERKIKQDSGSDLKVDHRMCKIPRFLQTTEDDVKVLLHFLIVDFYERFEKKNIFSTY